MYPSRILLLVCKCSVTGSGRRRFEGDGNVAVNGRGDGCQVRSGRVLSVCDGEKVGKDGKEIHGCLLIFRRFGRERPRGREGCNFVERRGVCRSV